MPETSFMQSSETDSVWGGTSETHSTQHNMTVDEYGDAFRSGYLLTRRFLLSRGAAPDDAEEVAQAAWAKGWEYRNQLQNPSRVAVWVNSIAKNMLLNQYGRQHGKEPLNEASAGYTHDGVYDNIEVGGMLRKCKPHDRGILRRHYLEGYTTAEIAKEVGVTPTAIRVQLLRIRQAVRRNINERHHRPVRTLEINE